MSAVLQRIASIANGLTKAELHVLIELAARAEAAPELETTASSRELAQATGLARASVQTAIDSLNKKQLVHSGYGSPTRCAVHQLLCLPAAKLETSGPTVEPEVAQNLGQSGLNTEPEVAQRLSHRGLTARPDVARNLGQGGPIPEPVSNERPITYESPRRERANARADSINFDFDKTIDRLQKAQKSDFDESLFELARKQIASHHVKFAREENRLPGLPDDTITAQFLAVADWPKLEAVLYDLASERKEAGHSYGWYVTVALQRVHGISPGQVREIRARLKANGPKSSLMPAGSHLTRKPPKLADVGQLKEQIRALATVRSMR